MSIEGRRSSSTLSGCRGGVGGRGVRGEPIGSSCSGTASGTIGAFPSSTCLVHSLSCCISLYIHWMSVTVDIVWSYRWNTNSRRIHAKVSFARYVIRGWRVRSRRCRSSSYVEMRFPKRILCVVVIDILWFGILLVGTLWLCGVSFITIFIIMTIIWLLWWVLWW